MVSYCRKVHSIQQYMKSWFRFELLVHVLFFCFRLVTFMNQHSATDVLVTGITQSDNPFRDQKGCAIL